MKIKNLLFAFIFSALLAFGQSNQVTLQAPAPPAVSIVTAQPQPPLGTQQRCYWVIAIFPIGQVFPTASGCTSTANLSGGGTVVVNWQGVPGATGYIVLRTAGNNAYQFPASGTCTNCLLANNVGDVPVTDTGASLSSFTISSVSPASATVRLDNQNYAVPLLISTTPLISPNSGLFFSQLGTPANGVTVYCFDCQQVNPCAGGGTGAFAQGINGQWQCGGGGGGGGGVSTVNGGTGISTTNPTGPTVTVNTNLASGVDGHITTSGTNPQALNFQFLAGDLQNIPGTLTTSQLISTQPLISTGSGAPVSACTVVSQPQLYIETDSPNFYLWYCAAATAGAATTGWQRISSSTANGIGFGTFAIGTYASLAGQTGSSFFPQGTVCTSPASGSACLAMLTGLEATGSPSFIINGASAETYLPFIGNPDAQSGAGYTVSAANDAFKLVTLSNAGAQTVNLPSTVPTAGWYVDIQNIGAGTWTLSGNTNNIDGAAGSVSLVTNAGIRVFAKSSGGYATQRGIGAGAGTAFSGITTGSNTAATMTCGTGCTITVSGSGVNNATQLNGTNFSGSNGDLVSFGASNVPADSGVVAANVVTASSNFNATNQILGAGGANKTAASPNNPALNTAATPSAITQGYTNAAGGTTAGLIAKLNGTNDTVVSVGTSDTEAIGICVSGCSTSGTGQIAISGTAACTFDNTSTAGHYVQISTGTAGDCHDAGATLPTSGGTIIGRVADGGAAGSHNVSIALTPPGSSGGGSGTGVAGVNQQTGAGYTVVSGDCGKSIQLSNAAAQTVTLLGTAPASPCWYNFNNYGAGLWTINPNGVSWGSGSSANPILGTGQTVTVYSDGTKYWIAQGAVQAIASTAHGSITWTKPQVCNWVEVILYGAGGSGGGGQGAAAANARGGGSGGGGGARVAERFACSDLGTTVTVTIGTGASGGAGGSSANGTVGTSGGNTTFGTVLFAGGGGGGAAGNSTNTDSGGSGGGCLGAGSVGTNASSTGGAPTTTAAAAGATCGGAGSAVNNFGHSGIYGGGSGGGTNSTGSNGNGNGGKSGWGGSGGGAGGGVTSANTGQAGGTAGLTVGGSGSTWDDSGGGGVAGGTNGGGAGNPGANGNSTLGGGGGSGGGGNTGGTGGAGGAGGTCGGGGGGGGGGTSTGGNGGAGADGCAYIFTS